MLKLDCRCIEIDLWDGDSPSSSEAEDNVKKPDDVNKLSGLLKKKLNRLRSRSDPKADDDDQPKPDDLMPMPWRTASGRSEPVVYHGYTATKEVPFRKVRLAHGNVLLLLTMHRCVRSFVNTPFTVPLYL